MYTNLNKEMATRHITQGQISALLNVRTATISDKIRGKSRFYLDEAMRIKNVFFPHFEIEYLFHQADMDEKHQSATTSSIKRITKVGR